MSLKTQIRKKIIDITGYWTYRRTELPTGTDIMEDLKYKINIDLKIIFDVGANIGQTALAFSERFPEATIYSFEPISSTYDELQRRIKKLKNVCSYQLAFSDKAGLAEVRLFDKSFSALNSLNPNSMNTSDEAVIETIKIETIDEFLNSHASVKSIDLLKIDTEGFELPVLKGATETINQRKIKLIYLEVGFDKDNDRNSYFVDVQGYLESRNFTFLGFYEICHVGILNKRSYGNALYINNEFLDKVKMI